MSSLSDIRLEVFTDAAFGNLHDGGSRGGYLIFVSDGLRSAPLDWSSHRLKRVARSTLAAEAQALLDGISGAMYYRQLLMEIGNLEKPPQVICYSAPTQQVNLSPPGCIIYSEM